MALAKVGPKYRVTIPKSAREAVGLKVGDFVEATVGRDGIVLRPKVVVDERVQVKKRLERAEADVKAGKVLGPFASARAALRAVRQRAHARLAH